MIMKQKVALVLSGGGARGIAHIGVIEELESRNYEITSIAGTSMGSVIGGVFAAGNMVALKEWLVTLDKRKVLHLVDFTLSKQGLLKGDRVFKAMKEFIPDTLIEEMRIPFAAVAVDILHKREVVFTTGSMYNAIRASVAIPTILTPVRTVDGLLVDGGVMNNIPIDHVHREKGDLLLAVNVNADIPVSKPAISKKDHKARETRYRKVIREFDKHLVRLGPRNEEVNLGYFDLISRTIGVMTHQMAQMSLKNHSPDILIEISINSCGMYDFYRAEEMIEIGRHAARERLEAASLLPDKTSPGRKGGPPR